MSVRRSIGVAGALALLVVVGLAGASLAQNDRPFVSTGYLAAGAVDGTALLGPPPAPDSARGREDRAFFNQSRKLQGTARWALATRDADLRTGVLQRFSCAVGAALSRETTPATLNLLYRIEGDVRGVGNPPKDHYGRKRPPIGNTAPLCVPRGDWMATNGSYPSGHAMIGWSWALVLSQLAPERTNALVQNGRDFGLSRAVCGVHFLSDVEAGRELGAAMLAREQAEPAFQADLAVARAELTAARAKGAPTDCADYPG